MEKTNNQGRWGILIIVVMSTFMSALDGSIVNVALPRMAKLLGVTTSSIQLVVTSYLIVIVATVLIFGRLGDMYGKTRLFNFGLGLFTVGSLLCGITNSFVMLVLARVIQALGAAGMMANSQGIITEVFPVNERGRALGFSGTAVALGSLVGPGLGGLIVGTSSWEYIFLINVPVGIISLFYAVKLLPKGHKVLNERLDYAGAILFMFTIVPLFVALSGGIKRGFSDPFILSGFAIAVLAFMAFIAVEKKREHPLIQLDIFENKLFSLSIFCGFISFVAIFCNNIILPFFLQDVMQYAPQYAGAIMMTSPLILGVVAPVSGYLSDRMGSEILTFVGLLCISLGLFLMSTLHAGSNFVQIMVYIGTTSLGMGLFQSPNNALIMSTVPRHKLGIAGSVNALIRNLGMVSGIALATTLLFSMMSIKMGTRVIDIAAGSEEAIVFGMRSVYQVAAGISLFGAILTFLRVKRHF